MKVLPWTKKYLPQSGAEVVGANVAKVRTFLTEYKKGAKPLLLSGPPGTGKTATVYALAAELDKEVIEVNASDTRNKASVNELLGAAMYQQSLFFKGKIILVDEADGLSGRSDRGGVQALVALLKNAPHPVIITANDATIDKLKAVKKISTVIEYPALEQQEIMQLLERIAAAEKLKIEDRALEGLARRAGGDGRAAINDLQTLSGNGNLSLGDLDALGDREQKEKIVQALLRIFKTTSADVALPAFDNLDENVDELFLWIDESLAKEYTKPEDLARAYDALAEADRFFGRIRRWQYYRFYVYIYNLLSAGIAIAKAEKYPGVQKYKRSSKLLSIWMANQRNAKQKSIAAKIAAGTHASVRRTLQDTMPYVRAMGQAEALGEQYDLSDEEIGWLARE